MNLIALDCRLYKEFFSVPPHMLSKGIADIDSGLIKTINGYDFACPFPGDYVRWSLIDIRLYHSSLGWAKDYPDTPFRLYFEDYDDWNIERMFATEEEARQVIKFLSQEPISCKILKSFGFKTI